ncbi:MAG: hypothetical protein GWN99_07620 [Gemmatimonadetes bacterium]|uniref:Peptidase C-terminal archaeal/bacterial domain-containing protein n=1 Tax=Candidatus Kutchimonas denitrificans TaxID=3056748 RepID=A0AAE4ZAE5_9BACT|nr:hypothetical protein [Gemmatimonadota bacterium]NIR75096.1 hypothetical protein [Candidatus Kutchimonas denitrificans]NIS00928.1 hypothetical protein [Gemmatimonadota bacterium]NIT66545.1 hypothetical protein [Gemmatimonadota bacterium]NIU52891.1 hypothetical protein [Gemmatimonadota bacterium]
MWRRAICMAVAVVLASAVTAYAQKPSPKAEPQEKWRSLPQKKRPAVRAPIELTAAVTVPESEPNDDAANADAVTLDSDMGTGTIDPAGDEDWWSFTATADEILEIDVDASEFGSQLDPILELYASDGTTLLAGNDDFDGLDSRIIFQVSSTDTYYIRIIDFSGSGSASHTYTINFNTTQPGPGDPPVTIVSGLDQPFGIATGNLGNLFVAETGLDRIVNVSLTGAVSTLAAVPEVWGALAFDVFGNLLATSENGNVYKVMAGSATPFITDLVIPFWIARAPDGSLWISDIGNPAIHHYEPDGSFIEAMDLSGTIGTVGPIGFSPAGELHASTGADLYKLVDGVWQAVITDEPFMWGFSFDVNGNIYLSNPQQGGTILYSPSGVRLGDPFAFLFDASLANAFGRNEDGTWNNTLFGTDIGSGNVIQFNSDGVLADGLPLGPSIESVTASMAADHLFGLGGLTAAEQNTLDLLGNDNGAYDLGDFRAFLVATGVLSGSLSATVQALDPTGNRR